MPTWFPEGNTVLPQDNETRTLAKWCQHLYDLNGPGFLLPFPEGNRPLPSDDDERLEKKILALQSISAVIASVITAFDGSNVFIDWNPVSAAVTSTSHYKIYRNGGLIGSVDISITEYTDFTVQSGQTYVYTVYYIPR